VNRMTPLPCKTGNLIVASAFGLLAAMTPSPDARAQTPRTVRVGVNLPGLMAPLPVSVSSTGEATVLEYPKRWSGSLNVITFASPLGQKLEGAVCDGVASRLRIVGDPSIPPMMKDRIRDSIRQESAVTFHASSVSFLPTQGLLHAILDAAKGAGLPLNAVTLANPLDASSFEVALSLTDKALSHAIGGEDELREQLSSVFGAGTLLTGETAGEFSAVDLACDLRSGEAKLSLRFKGSVGGAAADRDLLAEDAARELVQRLDRRKSEFQQGDSALDARRNAFVAGWVLGEELRAVKVQSPDLNDRIALFERLFSLSSGRPLALDGETLSKAIRVPHTGSVSFSGTAAFTLTSRGGVP
jgi:hypothetical protein